MVPILNAAGFMRTVEPHDYHCTCSDCAFDGSQERFNDRSGNYERVPAADLRCQRDSTADGEFITRILHDWSEMQSMTVALTAAASQVNATTSNRCGLHVHVDTMLTNHLEGAEARSRIVPRAYLAFERYFTEIVAPGSSIRKREMNTTLMQACRQYVSDGYTPGGLNPEPWKDMGRAHVDDMLAQVISRDRHVDLNWARRHGTWEFRVFNATNAAWRIELAARMSVAFVEATPELCEEIEQQVRGSKYWPEGCDSPWGEIVRPAWSELPAPHPTKRPVVPMERFIDLLCDVDPDLRPLIERQANFMRARYAARVEVAV
jgi:hypothetical protein